MITQQSSSLVSSARRPLPLAGRPDLARQRIDYQGVPHWVVKDPAGLKYHRLRPEQHRVLELLDGSTSLEQIRDRLNVEYPTVRLTLVDIQRLITDLYKKGLLLSNRSGQAGALLKRAADHRKQQIKNALKSILFLRLPGWDPQRTLDWLHQYVRPIFFPSVVALTWLFVASAWIFLAVDFAEFRRRLPEFHQFFGWPNLLWMWATLGIAKIIHEFGHGITCRHFRSECHEMGVMLLVFSPCLYCDVTDSWMLRNKWQRIAIGAAGMYIEVVLSAMAIYIWRFSQPGMLHFLALNTFFVTTITTVIFNINPLMRFDGYYMLSDFLEIPNLRAKADKLVRDTFSWYCLGIRQPHDPFMPETGRGWFILFAVASAVYRWFILFGISLFLYTVLKPYGLQSIGITMAVLSLAGAVIGAGMNIYRIVSAPRSEPMSPWKLSATITAVAALVVAALMIPLPLHVEAAFLIEPHNVHHVYVTTPGSLEQLLARPGETVKADQLLARLVNPELQDKYQQLLSERTVQLSRVSAQHALEDLAQEKLAVERLESLNQQIADLEREVAELSITAPEAGVVVEPPRTPEPKLEDREHQLGTWHGTPLDPRNAGCYLEPRTHLLSIAPDDKLQAVLFIDQADRNDVAVGQQVEIKFEHLADRTYTGTITEIAQRHAEYAPETLTNKAGGGLATARDERGEKLTSVAYQATVMLPEDTDLLKTGMRGKARCEIENRTAGEWLWRYMRRTFHFRL